MSKKENVKLKKDNNIFIEPVVEKKNDMNENKEIMNTIQDISGEILVEDFDFFKEDSKRLENIGIIEETIEEIKKDKNKDLELDEFIEDCIENLEEYSSIFSFEDLIYDPEYSLKSLMKSLKKVINFQYFYTKFTLPKDKNEYKEGEKLEESKNRNEIKCDKEKKELKKGIIKPKNDKKGQYQKNIGGENKNEININRETKEGKNIYEEKEEENKTNKQVKVGKNVSQENKDENNISMGTKEGKNVREDNKDENNINKETNRGRTISEKSKDNNNANREAKKEKSGQNKEDSNNKIKNSNVNFQKYNRKNKIILESRKNEFISKLSLKEKNGKVSNNKSDQAVGIFKNDKSEKDSQFSISSSKISNQTTSSPNNEKSDIKKDETNTKFEEYKLMNFDNILSIINNNANAEEDELIEGKNYESKVRKYFQIVLDICSDKFLSVYKNSGTTIQGLYKYYEDLIGKNKVEKNENIYGNSMNKNEYNKLEFDLIVDNVSKNVINKIVDVFKSSIICKNMDENIGEATEYQIVGEVAKNILNQSIDKYKQIGKIIDVLLIEQYLTSKDLIALENSFACEIVKEYNNLKLDINKNKFLFLFTDGSFVELKKALIFKESELTNSNNDYQSVKIKSIFPIKNKSRYCKNIIYFKKIIESLNKSTIPYIIFYVGEELHNGIDKILINYIKNKKDKETYKTIIYRIERNEQLISKNISQSFFIKTINKRLQMLNKSEIFSIIKNIIVIPENKYYDYFDFLYENLIEKINTKKKYYILIFFPKGKFVLPEFKKRIQDFNEKNCLTQIEIIFTNKEDLLNEYSKYKDKKIIKTFIVVKSEDKKEVIKDFEIKELEDKDLEVKDISNFYEINLENINFIQIKKIIIKYILSNFSHYSEETYMNLDIFHKKIIFDIKNLEKDLPIKAKQVAEDKIFIEKIRNLFDDFPLDDIIKKKTEEILELIMQCIGEKIYKYLFKSREEYIKKLLNLNLKRISLHIFCFSIYDEFFKLYLTGKI